MNTQRNATVEEFGVITCDPLSQFENPNLGLSREELFQRRMEFYLTIGTDARKPKATESASSWPKVTNAIKRGETFVIESKNSTASLFLRFDPSELSESYFIIHRGKDVFDGTIEKLQSEDQFESDERVSMLMGYNAKFCLIGSDYRRPHHKFVWRIGLNHFRQVVDSDMD